jgi:hypothetical protein
VVIPVITSTRVEEIGHNEVADIALVTGGGTALLAAQVPVGYGLLGSGPGVTKTAGTSLTDLIREIQAHTDAGSHDQNQLVGAGSGFLQGLPGGAPLIVQTVVPTVAAGAAAPSAPIVISGATQSEGAPLNALVIDTRALAQAVIDLQNVQFATVIGTAHVTGNGVRSVWGDGASQTLQVGGTNAMLHGGAGNDIVEATGANAQVFGDDGDDVLSATGTAGIDGGSGSDTIVLAGAARADYSLRIQDGTLTMRQADGSVQTVANVETLQFGGANGGTTAVGQTDVGILVRMYDTLFQRHVDEGGINFWLGSKEAGLTLHQIADYFIASDEAQPYAAMSNEQFVAALYTLALGREGRAEEVAWWADGLARGYTSRGDVLLGFAESAEKIGLVGVISTTIETTS